MTDSASSHSGPQSGQHMLFIVNDLPFFRSHRLALGQEALRRGVDVHIAGPWDEQAEKLLQEEGYHVHRIPLNRSGMNPVKELVLVLALWKLVRALKPDLLHAVTMKPVVYGGLVARLLRVPAVIHAVTGLGLLFIDTSRKTRIVRQIVLMLYRFAFGNPRCRIVFQNPDDLQEFDGRGLISRDQVDMIRGCGVDMGKFTPAPLPETPVVMMPSRYIGDKGIREYVAAVTAIRSDYPQTRFVLVGKPDLTNPTSLQPDEIAQLERDGIIEDLGFSTDMPTSLNNASIIVLPSYREGLPRGLIEAAACGRPIIATDVPGCREVVEDGKTGYLVPARDSTGLAAAMRQLLDHPEQITTMGRAGRDMAVAEFSVDYFVSASFDSYARSMEPGL